MNLGNILVILACLAAGYAIVSVLMKTNADDLRPPPKNEPPPVVPTVPAASAARIPQTPRAGDWSLILDVPRSAGPRDIEAAFRRQLGKAEAAADQPTIERLRLARETALAEAKQRA